MQEFLFHGFWNADVVDDSMARACDFFHIEPSYIKESWTMGTGVYTNDETSLNDDVFIYNPRQLADLGISQQDSLDLVMTHECTHRIIQAISDTLTPHEEEICCDYMVGVRAGLNNMDSTQIESVLRDQQASETHPAGSLRIEAISHGRQFAEQYMSETGHTPSFDECFADFQQAFSVNSSNEDEGGNISFKGYSKEEIDRRVAKADKEMRYNKSQMNYYANWIRQHGTDGVIENAASGLKSAERDYEHWKSEYQKWKNTRPDPPKKFVDTEVYIEESDTFHEYSPEVSKTYDKMEDCQDAVNSQYSKMQAVRAKYGVDSSEYRQAKRAFDRAQSELKYAREDYQRAVQTAHRNGTL